MLRGMRLNLPFDDLIPSITKFYERKIELWQRMGKIGSEFIGGPKKGVDYSKLAAEMPKIRANWISSTNLCLRPRRWSLRH